MSTPNKFTTFLWFDGNAEEAATLYTSIFEDSRIVGRMPGPGDKPTGVTFELGTQRFTAFNGGPHYKLTAATSIFVACETQEEVDRYWEQLLAGGGKATRCGWLDDRFGLSWQIIPNVLPALLSDPDPARASRAMQAMMKMQKLDIAELKRAADAG
jgi:predicted 3-demethylubiquinone-9 3-methyltransferase (glyoxalase superfamily)